jgi:hypothetical protein
MSSEDKTQSLFGNYRAKVINSVDPQDFGRVMVWIPDIMINVPEDRGIWALPANNPISGLNTEGDSGSQYMGSSYTPQRGSWVFVFFECGNINRPYFFGGLNLQNTPILPEMRVGSNKTKKWVPFKSNKGRTIVISDDPSDERVEITGKKRQLSNPPSGDIGSVYTIDGNQTTILLEEIDGQEKILIRTYKGDFINIDVANQKLQAKFASDIIMQSGGSISFKAEEGINIEAGTKVDIQSGSDTNIKSGANLNQQSSADININAGTNLVQESAALTSINSAGSLIIEASADVNINPGNSLNFSSPTDVNISSQGNLNLQAIGTISGLAVGDINFSGANFSYSGANIALCNHGSVYGETSIVGDTTPANPSNSTAPEIASAESPNISEPVGNR